MDDWQAFDDHHVFVRAGRTSDGRPWYQVVMIWLPKDTGNAYVVRGGVISELGKGRLRRLVRTYNLTSAAICRLDGCTIAWMMADDGMMDFDYGMPHVTTTDATEFVGTLNEYGIHELDHIA